MGQKKLPLTLNRFVRLKSQVELLQRHATLQRRQSLAAACETVVSEMNRWLDDTLPPKQ